MTRGMPSKIKNKLKQVMFEPDATKRLTGRVEIDDACPAPNAANVLVDGEVAARLARRRS